MIWRAAGALLVVVGLVLGGAVVWQVWGTNVPAAAAQQQAAADLVVRWTEPESGPGDVAAGEPIATLEIPRIGGSWTVVEGVGDPELAVGPGHYPGTAEPGEVGNLAIAGHRVGHGAPFLRLDELQVCDDITVTGRDASFVYRVLPQPGQTAPCGLPDVGLPGQQIVTPDRGDLVLPVPGRPGVEPEAAVLTLTTCHPRYSARQRLIVHAVRVDH